MTIEPTALATAAVTTASFFLTEAGKGIAKKSGEMVLERFLKIIRRKPKPAEALEELANSPADGDAQGALRLQLKTAIAADPRFAEELQAAVEKVRPLLPPQVQNSIQIGSEHKSVQVSGEGNTTSIS